MKTKAFLKLTALATVALLTILALSGLAQEKRTTPETLPAGQIQASESGREPLKEINQKFRDPSSVALPSEVRWTQTSGPGGGRVQAMLAHGQFVFAGTYDGDVYRSSDQGQSWQRLNFRSGIVYTLGSYGSTVFVGTIGGLSRSTDNGETWTNTSNGLGGARGYSLVAHSSYLFAGTTRGVFRSTDGGANWVQMNNGLGEYSVLSMASSGQTLFAGTFNNGTFISNDDGQSWLPSTNGIGYYEAYQMLVVGANVYAACGGGVYRTSDQGRSWTELKRGSSSLLNSRSLAVVGSTIFAGTRSQGLYRLTSSDVWVLADSGLPREDIFAMTGKDQYLLAGFFGPGIYRSGNLGQTWAAVNQGFIDSNVSGFATLGANVFASVRENGVYVTNDNGQNWRAMNKGITCLDAQALTVHGLALFVGTDCGVFRSTDQGANWSYLGLDEVNFTSFVSLGTTLFTGNVGSGVHFTTNNGQSWTEANNGLTDKSVQALVVSGNRLLAGTRSGGIFISGDNGQHWVQSNTGLTDLDVDALIVSGTTILAGTPTGLFRSVDGGQTWLRNGVTIFGVKVFAANGETLYAGTEDTQVFRSLDQGRTWVEISDGLWIGKSNVLGVRSLLAKDTTLFAGTWANGVFIAGTNARAASVVSAASFNGAKLAPNSIASVFGEALAIGTQVAAGGALPTQLAGTQVFIRDASGRETVAPLFFVAPTQINFLIPGSVTPGAATIKIIAADGQTAEGALSIALVAPGLFSANANGQGVVSAVALRISADGSQSFEPVARFDAGQNKFVAVPLDLGPESDQLFLILFGTGERSRSSLSAVTVKLGGTDAQVLYVGAQGDFVGLDQINVRVPRNLAGRGEVEVLLTTDGLAANPLTVHFR